MKSTRAGRPVVLKKLDDDCLLDGQLHPAIRERLERVRELPVKSVTNLHGVERIDGVAHLVWDYVEGSSLDELQPADWKSIVREVVLAVESLHAAGIVHGAIHARNVFLDRDGNILLTHVSPLLYGDPRQDHQDAIAMLLEQVEMRDPSSQLSGVLATALSEDITLADLYTRLADDPASENDPESHDTEPRTRRRMILAAIVVLLAGLGITIALLRYVNTQP